MAFAAEGPGVPIREIARRAEVGVATVHRHFPSKEALLTEVFAEQTAMCSAIVREGLAASDPWRGFRLVIEKLLEAHARDREFALTSRSCPGRPPSPPTTTVRCACCSDSFAGPRKPMTCGPTSWWRTSSSR